MSDTPHPSDQTPVPAAAEHELSVDLAAFLPDDVELAPADESEGADESGPDLGALGQFETDLGGVDAALLALDAGTYGTCAACGATIADHLLAADPTRLGRADHPGATPEPVSGQ